MKKVIDTDSPTVDQQKVHMYIPNCKKSSGDINVKRALRNRILDMRVSLHLHLMHLAQMKRRNENQLESTQTSCRRYHV